MIDDALIGDTGRRPDAARRRHREPDREFEHAVLNLLEQHGRTEAAVLESYQAVAARSSAGEAVRYLVELILDDERRHHEVFAQMANDIRSFVWEVPVEPRLPVMGTRSDPELLAETKRLLAIEKQDAKELRALRKQLKHKGAVSLDPLMIELMLHDTAKHIAILEYIEAHLRR